ncbi:MAG: methyltransferase domain-containing protein [Candidatus Competibacterales bacterium]
MEPTAYANLIDSQGEHWWYRARREILAEVLAALTLPQDARILEVGCGAGGNLPMLGRYGRVMAVELDTAARHHARAFSGIDVQAGWLPDGLPFDGQAFDLICLFDVLEHIQDDRGALAALGARLKPRGHLVLTVPAHQWLYGRHDRWLCHFRRYGHRQLAEVLEANGFGVRRLHYFNCLLFPVVLVVRWLDRDRHRRSWGTATPPAWLNGLLYQLFRLERHWLRRRGFPVGVSLVAVASPLSERRTTPPVTPG